jgi:chaperone required for assembly of F1-ATPase
VTAPPGKRGFTTVSVRPQSRGFGVFLDDRPLRTPAGANVVVPSQALAEAVAAEWRLGRPRPNPNAVPLTRMTLTAIDRISAHRVDIEQQLLDYADTDLLCYRAQEPPDLIAREQAVWQPLLDWLAHRHDALLAVVSGVMARPQNAAALRSLKRVIAGLDIWHLAALSVATSVSGSLVIGLALLDGRLDADSAFDAAELDATFQIEKWGIDDEATKRRDEVRAELGLAARFLSLL